MPPPASAPARLRDLAKAAEDELRDGEPVNPERIDDLGMAVEEVRAFIAELLDATKPH